MNIKTWFIKTFLPTKRCRVCKRPLTSKRDRLRGIGANCLRKEKAQAEAQQQHGGPGL